MTPKGMADMEHKKMMDKKGKKAAPGKKSVLTPKKSGKR